MVAPDYGTGQRPSTFKQNIACAVPGMRPWPCATPPRCPRSQRLTRENPCVAVPPLLIAS